MQHLRWDPCGRTFRFTDDLGQVVPNKFVEKHYVGQKNVFENDRWFPYIWDSNNRILKFGTCEIRLTDSQLEFWQKDEKLLGCSLHPEIQEATAWIRKQTTVSGLRVTERITEEACDFATISYDVETEDQKSTVEITVGGSNRAIPIFTIETKQAGRQRLSIDYDRKGESVQVNDFKGNPLPICAYRFSNCFWSWDRTEIDDHVIEQKTAITQLHLKEADYQASVIERVAPDTWGPYETSDDCFDYYSTYYDHYENVLYQGYWDNSCNAGWIWSNITVPPGATAEDGCKIDIYVTELYGTPQGNLQVSDEEPPDAWDSSHYPSNASYHSTTVTWDETSTDAQASPEIKTLIQIWLDVVGRQSGDDMKVGWLDDGSGSNCYLLMAAEEHGTYTEAQLTIVYSTGGAVELAGIISAVASLAGSLALTLPLVGAIDAQAGVDGLLKPIRGLLGQIGAQTIAEGTLKLTLGLAGEISAQSTTEGILKPLIGLVGEITGGTTANGILSRALALAGNVSALAGVMGDLSIAGQVALAGTIDALSTVQASLSATKPLQGTIDAQAAVQGILGLIRGIAGTIDAQSTAQATLTHYLGLIGAIAGQAAIDGDLTIETSYILLAGVVEALSSTEGTIQMDWSLAGEVGASAEVQGLLGLAREMAGTIEGQAALVAALTVALLAALETIELESAITREAEHSSAILFNTEMSSEILRSVELISRLNSQNN